MERDFQPTRWSLIQQAADSDGDGRRERAWEEFDGRYRAPLLAFVKRSGWGSGEAEDLVQEFFAKLAEREWLSEADPALGKMRTFLLGRLKFHLSDARKHLSAKKRGGDFEMVSFDDGPVVDLPSASSASLDQRFDCEWAHAILDRTLATLRSESEASGKGGVFDLLQSQITGDAPEKIAHAAGKLGQTEGATRMQLQRLRDQFRKRLRAEVAETLLPGEDVVAELRYLASVLG